MCYKRVLFSTADINISLAKIDVLIGEICANGNISNNAMTSQKYICCYTMLLKQLRT